MNKIELDSGEEQSYRRGYVHGYITALEDYENSGLEKKTGDQMTNFLNKDLMEWRYKEPVENFLNPPSFKPKE